MAKKETAESQLEAKLKELEEKNKALAAENDTLKGKKEAKPTGLVYLRKTKHGNPSGVDKKFVNPTFLEDKNTVKVLEDEGWVPEEKFGKAA